MQPSHTDPGLAPTTGQRLLAGARRHERTLWGLAVVAMVLDIALTAYGLGLGLAEMNPVAANAITDHGIAGMALLKLVGFAAAAVGWLIVPRRFGALVPLALATPWLLAAVVNVVMIASVV